MVLIPNSRTPFPILTVKISSESGKFHADIMVLISQGRASLKENLLVLKIICLQGFLIIPQHPCHIQGYLISPHSAFVFVHQNTSETILR